jgi:hypothetical protein
LLCSWQIAASLLKDILGRGLFCLAHLFATGQRKFMWAQEALAFSLHLLVRTRVNDVQ